MNLLVLTTFVPGLACANAAVVFNCSGGDYQCIGSDYATALASIGGLHIDVEIDSSLLYKSVRFFITDGIGREWQLRLSRSCTTLRDWTERGLA